MADKKESLEIATPAVRDDGKVKRKAGGLSVPVYSLLGKSAGSVELPKEVFGVKVNQSLIAQAMRVYLNNQKAHHSNTKTRGQVVGSTRKIYSQKGTGRARHGAITAPIFVGGGVALGPKYRKTVLDLPQKMKKAALLSSLSQKAASSEVIAVSGLDKATGKTKEMANFFQSLGKKSALVVADKNMDNVFRSVRNLKGIEFLSADRINVFEVVKHQSLVLTREAVEGLLVRFAKRSMKESPGPASAVSVPLSVGPLSSLSLRAGAGTPSSASPLDSTVSKRKGVKK